MPTVSLQNMPWAWWHAHKHTHGTQEERRRQHIHEIGRICQLQKKIRRNHEAVIDPARYHLPNMQIEAANSKINLKVNLSYKLKNIDDLLAMIMLKCSDISVHLQYQELDDAHAF